MSRKVIVREGVNVRTLEYGSGSGDRMDLFIDEGETLLSGMASAHSCTVILTDASSGQDYRICRHRLNYRSVGHHQKRI